jgi:F-type H+-transporting ATPase subunit delta
LSRVANRYSKALFRAAQEEDKIDTVEVDLQSVRNLIAQSSEFRNLLFNPLIPAIRKTEQVSTIFKDKVDILSHRFLHLLCDKKRSNVLPEVIDRFYELLYEFKGILTGKIISAGPLGGNPIENISAKIREMTGKPVQLELETDSELIAGFVVKIKDTVIDLSVKGQLEKLRNKLVYG